jgi:hypothetical protein
MTLFHSLYVFVLLQYSDDGSFRGVGLGKGKPFCASKIAKKKLGFGNVSGRAKGMGNGGTCVGKVIGGYQKRQRVTDFGRKRAPKAKMRGIFGVPGLGLQVRIFLISKGGGIVRRCEIAQVLLEIMIKVYLNIWQLLR